MKADPSSCKVKLLLARYIYILLGRVGISVCCPVCTWLVIRRRARTVPNECSLLNENAERCDQPIYPDLGRFRLADSRARAVDTIINIITSL